MAQRPVAIAGTDTTGTIGNPTLLDGSGSYDPEGFSIDTYSWFLLYIPPGSTTIINNDDMEVASLTPDTVGTCRIFLVVTAGGRSSEPDPLKAPPEAFIHVNVPTTNNGWVIPARGQRDWDEALYTLLTEVDAAIPFSLPPNVVVEGDNVNRLGSGTELAGVVPIADGSGGVSWGTVSGGGGGFTISSFNIVGGNLIEVGDTLTDPSFTASYDGTVAAASVIDDQGGAASDVTGSPTAFSYIDTYTMTAYGDTVTWTLSAADAGTGTDDRDVTKTWTQKVYWGVALPGGNSEVFIKSLANDALDTDRARTFIVNAAAGQKIYFAYRSAYGDAVFTVNGFSGGFFKVSGTISVTNDFGFVENYTLYESDNVGLGLTTVVVS